MIKAENLSYSFPHKSYIIKFHLPWRMMCIVPLSEPMEPVRVHW
mgnify:CR=1 FL=1